MSTYRRRRARAAAATAITLVASLAALLDEGVIVEGRTMIFRPQL